MEHPHIVISRPPLRIALLGGTGFVGRHLACRLAAAAVKIAKCYPESNLPDERDGPSGSSPSATGIPIMLPHSVHEPS